jgi:hypothetical protein
MGESLGYASADSLDTSWLPLTTYRCRDLSREQCVLQCMDEGEANGGGDGIAAGPMGVGSRIGPRSGCSAACGIVPNKHTNTNTITNTKHLNISNICTAKTLLSFT